MKIARDNKLYTQIDEIKSHSFQYMYFINMMNFRHMYSKNPKDDICEYIDFCMINKDIEHILDREIFTTNCDECIDGTTQYIKDYAYYNNPNYQVWVNIDFSLPKELLIAQIAELKTDFDNKKIDINSEETNTREFIQHVPSEFAKIIRRQYGDFLFIFDCKEIGYTNQEIIYDIYRYRNAMSQKTTTISQDSIRKYLKIAKEIYDFIEAYQ